VYISLAATGVLAAKVVDFITTEQRKLLHILVFEYN
jgi:hypothetical protein